MLLEKELIICINKIYITMAFKLGRYSFTGPIVSVDKIKDKHGVYAIVCKTDTEYFLIDVGESSELRTEIENNEKKIIG